MAKAWIRGFLESLKKAWGFCLNFLYKRCNRVGFASWEVLIIGFDAGGTGLGAGAIGFGEDVMGLGLNPYFSATDWARSSFAGIGALLVSWSDIIEVSWSGWAIQTWLSRFSSNTDIYRVLYESLLYLTVKVVFIERYGGLNSLVVGFLRARIYFKE